MLFLTDLKRIFPLKPVLFPVQLPQRPACSRLPARSACSSRRPRSSSTSSPPPCRTGEPLDPQSQTPVDVRLTQIWILSLSGTSQVSGLHGRAGGVRRGDPEPGRGRALHVHPPQPGPGRPHAPGHHAVCGQVEPSFITHP